ncbi:MAG: hypothetical protein NTZ65_03610 [Candidatus Berkelbacteria bacterium]|nr:hypothetical protein [Candidatus Berkelbacteria bacterium]
MAITRGRKIEVYDTETLINNKPQGIYEDGFSRRIEGNSAAVIWKGGVLEYTSEGFCEHGVFNPTTRKSYHFNAALNYHDRLDLTETVRNGGLASGGVCVFHVSAKTIKLEPFENYPLLVLVGKRRVECANPTFVMDVVEGTVIRNIGRTPVWINITFG